MARQTRRSKAATETPSALATPVSALSVADYTPTAASSPPTSVVPDSEANDEDELKLPEPPRASARPRRGAAAAKGKKRAVPDSEDLDDEEEEVAVPAVKKRRTGSTAFVELPRLNRTGSKASTVAANKGKTKAEPPASSDEEDRPLAAKSKGKGRARAPPVSVPASESEEEALAVKATSARGRGKGKAKAPLKKKDESDDEISFVRPRPSRAASRSTAAAKGKGKAKASAPPSDDELQADDALEYDSAAELAAESDDSGSEFGADEDEFEEDEDMEVDEDEDEPSSSKRRSPAKRRARSPSEEIDELDEDDEELDTPAARAAAAVEARLLKAAAGVAEYDIDSEEEAGLATKKGRGRGKGLKGKGKAKKNDQETGLVPSKEELKGLNREEKRMLRMKYGNPLKYEETMMKKELGRKLSWAEKASCALKVHHPELRDAWGDLEADVPIVEPVKAEQPMGVLCTLLPFQQESLYWMRKQELGIYGGGLLADEMGMGKTIQMIALMVSEPGRPNLIIAPTVAVMQWRNEIATHTKGMRVVVWHGAARENNIKELVKNDVVLTTYAVVESCFRKQEAGWKRKGVIVKEKSPVHSIEWNRVILDEAHNIKERATNTAKAAFALKAKYRWCLSGTPLQNRVGELYSLVRFLGVDPFSFYYCKRCDCKSLHWRFKDKKGCDDCGHSPMQHTCFWNNEILTPIQKHSFAGPGKLAFKKLHILLERIMLRRTKLQKAEDLGLPPRTIVVRRDFFSPEEKELYLSLFSDAKREFSTYVDAGTLLNNYSNVFSLLTRMRQMACHPDLVLRSRNNAGLYIPGADEEAAVCRLCNDAAEDAIAAKCKHVFDRECIRQYLSTTATDDDVQPDCPVCHVPLTIDLEADPIDFSEDAAGGGKKRQGMLGRLDLDTWRSSTKIEALVEELDGLRRKDATTKSIVFSQFVNFLDLIAFRLQRAGFVVCRLEGTMSPQARDATIKHFMNNVHVTVFLVSLKAGGVALNLTEASRVYLMDSWWNPAVEFQAMDRIHRLGQHRPVRAIKLVVEDSIESRIVQLQEKKSAMVDATLSTDDQAMGRLTAEDLGFLFRL